MTPEEYERERQRLEDQLLADIELLRAAHRTRLRALEALREAAEPVVETPAAPPPPAPAPPAPPRRRKSPAWELDEAALAALDHVSEEFTREDLVRALGFQPNRSSLHRVLRRLESEGLIVVSHFGGGRQGNRYKKVGTVPDDPG